MRFIALLGIAVVFGAGGGAPAAQTNTNADICASSDADPTSPQQRIKACGALIHMLKDQPKALAAALIDRGANYWYTNKTDNALDRRIMGEHKKESSHLRSFSAYVTRLMQRLTSDVPLCRLGLLPL
jgi:hypothetical protein